MGVGICSSSSYPHLQYLHVSSTCNTDKHDKAASPCSSPSLNLSVYIYIYCTPQLPAHCACYLRLSCGLLQHILQNENAWQVQIDPHPEKRGRLSRNAQLLFKLLTQPWRVFFKDDEWVFATTIPIYILQGCSNKLSDLLHPRKKNKTRQSRIVSSARATGLSRLISISPRSSWMEMEAFTSTKAKQSGQAPDGL